MRRLAVAIAACAGACASERPRDEDPGNGDGRIHGPGVLDPDSPDFHGHELAEAGWNLHTCARCHGADFAGGAAGASCLGCHQDGPDDCSTCHADLGEADAHGAHLAAPLYGRQFTCGACHPMPQVWDDPGHVVDGDGDPDPPPVELRFSPIAAATPADGDRQGPPEFDRGSGRCANVYCHGDAFADRGPRTRPDWYAPGTGQADCGACHGIPPPDHIDDRCAGCHRDAYRHGSLSAAAHVDGRLALPGAGCDGCHGADGQAAPPPDLSGLVSPTALGVGAHLAHVTGGHRLRGPISCAECHRVPAAAEAPGHIDPAPAEVFPDPAGGLAAADGATPAWQRAEATCTGVYCHGATLTDAAPGLIRAPVWTLPGQAACGTCHGIPPVDGVHPAGLTLRECAGCHPDTVDGFGNILLLPGPAGATSEHIDGDVDHR